MKRLIPLMLFGALTGAAASAAVLLLGSSPGGHPSTTVSASASRPVEALGSSAAGSRREVSSGALTAAQIYRQDSPGVVSIQAVTAAGMDSGTGIVLNDSGLILTNDHVVSEATAITVSPGSSSSNRRTATLVGAEPNSDLALIEVDPSGLGLKPLKLADSSTVEVGDPVYAIGNPYGLDETLTRGIVSALDRKIAAPDGAAISGAIQTDAALNPGNSGGPLIDAQGEVIGVNSQIASEQTDSAGSQPGSTGVGFAISSDTAAQVIKAIESGGGGSSSSSSAPQSSGEAASSGQGSTGGEGGSSGEEGSSSGEGSPSGEAESGGGLEASPY